MEYGRCFCRRNFSGLFFIFQHEYGGRYGRNYLDRNLLLSDICSTIYFERICFQKVNRETITYPVYWNSGIETDKAKESRSDSIFPIHKICSPSDFNTGLKEERRFRILHLDILEHGCLDVHTE